MFHHFMLYDAMYGIEYHSYNAHVKKSMTLNLAWVISAIFDHRRETFAKSFLISAKTPSV